MAMRTFVVTVWALAIAAVLAFFAPEAATAQTGAPGTPPASTSNDRDREPVVRIPANVAALDGTRVEYVVSGPVAQADAAEAALEAALVIL